VDRDLFRKLAVHYIAPYYTLPPTSVFTSPTLRCSSACMHCGVWRLKERVPELSAEQWGDLLSDPFLSMVRTLWLSGGEPTLRDDLAEVARRAVDALPGMKSITVATNALHPFRLEKFLEDTLPLLEKRGIYAWIHISLDGPPPIHDRMRGVEGAFNSLERTVLILQRIKEKGVPIGWGFNCVITSVNARHLAETEERAAQLGGEITFNLVLPSGGFYGGDSTSALDADDKAAARSFIGRLINRADPYYRRHYETVLDVLTSGHRRHRCETLEATLYLDPDGTAYPCPCAYEEFRVSTQPGAMRYTWERLARYRSWIHRRYCPGCALGCSFGEGVSLLEFAGLIMEELR